jgi:hypothetical protein
MSYDSTSRSSYPLEFSVEHFGAAQNYRLDDAVATTRQLFSFWFVFPLIDIQQFKSRPSPLYIVAHRPVAER